ncbi:MauE/DoxX family redox-associated membrane protein [Kribbella sp. VKM Ac-2568]|uniref:MauE/DoxX family redox-associated membrane protein n=1 Tax=Kribbella sp. VKM Ac-2568 TaxID=2512219 RepID=UPI0010DFBCDE|nr:MauE/DoxX family redox-associated membrane protein [Kribbella sp. VKM Ac-2568]TCM50167.1 methylamine utilization protein MauE [Kribbella sp. VKM Ac-2568]
MKQQPWFPWVSLLARLVLGGVMLVAGALKVTDPEVAAQAVRAYELLPSGFDSIVGLVLPFLEIAIGLLLIVGYGVRPAAAVAGVFMVVFIAAVSSAWARGLAIDCGCFGGGGQVAPGQTKYLQEILRDVGLLVLAGWLWFSPRSKFALESDPHVSTGVTAS